MTNVHYNLINQVKKTNSDLTINIKLTITNKLII